MLISRVADHCFWFGRYLERAEATARSLGSTRDALMGAELEEGLSWLPIIIAAGEEASFNEHFGHQDPHAGEDGELVQHYMVWDEHNPSRLAASIAAIRANARSIRDHLSLEVWQQVNELHWWIAHDPTQSAGPLSTQSQTQTQTQTQTAAPSLAQPRAPAPARVQMQAQASVRGIGSARAAWERDRHAFYAHVVESSALTAGLLRTTMLRDRPFDFIILGSMLERASQTARILDVQHHALRLQHSHVVIDTMLWLALLRACTGYEPFMRRHRGRVTGKAVAAFLIQDPRFPRSIGFALEAALDRLDSIRQQDGDGSPLGGSSRDRLATLVEWLGSRTSVDLAGEAVHETLTHVVDEVHGVAHEIGVDLLGHGRD